MIEVQDYMMINKITVMSLIKTDLHLDKCKIIKKMLFNTDEVRNLLAIDGYTLLLSANAIWEEHGHTRVITYVHESLPEKQLKVPDNIQDLPIVTIKVEENL